MLQDQPKLKVAVLTGCLHSSCKRIVAPVVAGSGMSPVPVKFAKFVSLPYNCRQVQTGSQASSDGRRHSV